MITKGVSSVRSPVCNLKQFNATITHEAFTSAVVEEFRKEYQVDTKVNKFCRYLSGLNKSQLTFQCYVINDFDGAKDIEFIRRGMSELSVKHFLFPNCHCHDLMTTDMVLGIRADPRIHPYLAPNVFMGRRCT